MLSFLIDEVNSIVRNVIINELNINVKNKGAQSLISHGNDDGFNQGVSEHQRRKLIAQDIRALKVLEMLEDCNAKIMKITLRDLCVKTCNALISDCNGRTVEFW